MITQYRSNSTICTPVNSPNEPSCWIMPKSASQWAFSYVVHRDIEPYWALAKQYALGDRAFSSNNGPTFVSHQYLIAGESGHAVEVPNGQPWGCDAQDKAIWAPLLAYGQADPPVYSKAAGVEVQGPFPCYTFPTIVQNLDAAGITWKYYAAKEGTGRDLEPFQADKKVWNNPTDHANIISPDTQVLNDIYSGNLAQVSWITPTGLKSDHPGPATGNKGPSWVGSIVNAIGESPYWNNTAIVIMWDEWGGYYDPVHPKQYPDPQTGAREGLGFRVPLIVVSPYAKAGYVSHNEHEIAGTLRLIEETFGLPQIGDCNEQKTTFADCRADAFDDMFDFTQQPIPFKPIKIDYDAHYFLTHTDNTPGDTY
jgi:phospholipase C